MKNSRLCLIASAAVILSNHPVLLAQYPLYVQFHLTARVQEPFSDGYPQTFREKIVKIDNTKLLELLGVATTNDFTGAELVVDHSGLGFSVVRGTNVLADVSSLLSRSGATGAFVVRGNQSSDTSLNVRRQTVQLYRFMVGNAGNSFTFWADESARIAWTSTATNLPPKYFEKAHSYGFGDGSWNMRPAVFTGTIDLSSTSTGRAR
jgi:hypothetical protein